MSTPSLQRLTNLARILGFPNPFANYLDLRPRSDRPDYVIGRTYCKESGVLSTFTKWPGVSIDHGEELQSMVVNKSGGTIYNGQPVYIKGSQGNRPAVDLPVNTDDSTFIVIGLATHDIPNNQEGRICSAGLVRDIDTSAFAEGDIVYVSSVKGVLTNVKPPGTAYYCGIGVVTVSHINQGVIAVLPRRTERLAGITTDRPLNPRTGSMYFDITLGKPIWAITTSATGWCDATGTDA